MEELITLPLETKQIMEALGVQAMPESDAVSTWALEAQRKIYLDADVDEYLTAMQRLILRWNIEDKGIEPENRKPIWLYIMSYGGDIDYMWMLIDTIKLSKTPVYTVNIGVAGSAASLIFLAGKRRFMTPFARLIVHEGSAQLSGDAVKVMDQSESYKKQLKQMKEFILGNSQIPRAQLMKKRNNDWELNAQFCLENGACDEIITSLDEIC